ncbi:MAG: hypothetical protein ABH865_09450 [Candidatus Omnitrophota bacterium]
MEYIGWEYYDGNFSLFEPDEPMSAEEMQASAKKIMGRVYRFRNIVMLVVSIFSFPALLFFLNNLKLGWHTWYRPWRNRLIRFGGWIVMRGWTEAFKKDSYLEKLQSAKRHIKKT